MTNASKITLTRPILIALYGFPGSGKSYLARNLTESVQLAYLNSEKIRTDLFEKPQYSEREDYIVGQLMNYLGDQFLAAGLGIVYDANAKSRRDRRAQRELAKKHKADYLLLWLQIDQETAFGRTQKRDRRTVDDKYAQAQNQNSFKDQLSQMQNPKDEDYLVLSGKHGFASQRSAILNHFYKTGLARGEVIQTNITKPGLVNLIPSRTAVSVDFERRNIAID